MISSNNDESEPQRSLRCGGFVPPQPKSLPKITVPPQVPRFWKSKPSPVEGVPVIPYGNWFTGHLHLLATTDFEKSLERFSVQHADEQGRCTFWMGPMTPSLSVTRAEDVQTLLKVSSHRELFPVMKYHTEQFFGKYNLASLTGPEWKSKRAAIVKALHGRNVVEHHRQAFAQTAQTWVDAIDANGVDQVEDIGVHMKMLTLDAFGWATLHKDFGGCKKLKPSRILKDLDYLATEVMRRMTWGIWNPASHVYQLPTSANKKHHYVMERLEDYLYNLIDRRRELIADGREDPKIDVPNDLLTSLLEEAMGGNDDDSGSSVDEDSLYPMLADTIKSLIFAGYETTSTAMTYVLYLLARHPDVEARCLEEIEAQPQQKVYMEAVIKEAIRLFPPVISTTRSLEKEVRFGGIVVPKDTYLYFPIWIIQRDERHFPFPLKFIPERWARFDESAGAWVPRDFGGETEKFEGVPAGNPKALVAFSAGGRSCAGQRFAMDEMTIVLSTILDHFQFEVPDDYVLQPHREGFVQCPKGGIPMTIHRRPQAKQPTPRLDVDIAGASSPMPHAGGSDHLILMD